MPSKNRVRRDERRHLSQNAAAKSPSQYREPPSLGIVQPQPASTQLGFQRSILLAKERDHIAVLTIEPSSTAARSICNGITGLIYAKVQPDFSDTTGPRNPVLSPRHPLKL
jgi:hypothetical protein